MNNFCPEKIAAGDVSLHVKELSLVGSTNDVLSDLIKGGKTDTVIVAHTQNRGKGRLGREFFSPDTGLYFSIPFEGAHEEHSGLTVIAAVATAEAIVEIFGRDAKIKWVNDIFVDDKKVTGILCEGVFSADGKYLGAVMGIGVNVYPPSEGFPADIPQAGYVVPFSGEDKRGLLLSEIVKRVYALKKQAFSATAEKYARYSCLIGKCVKITQATGSSVGRVMGFDATCRLLAEVDGETKAFDYGDVRIMINETR